MKLYRLASEMIGDSCFKSDSRSSFKFLTDVPWKRTVFIISIKGIDRVLSELLFSEIETLALW
jgi:hypothetical protein